jgi:hypothetical protein
MSGGKDKDIVEEVFGRSMNDDERVSALFSRITLPSQISVEKSEQGPSDLTEAPAARDIAVSGDKMPQSINESSPAKTIRKRELIYQMRTVVFGGLVLLGGAFLVGSYLAQRGNDSTAAVQQQQDGDRTEIASLLAQQPSANVESESVLENANANSMALDLHPVIYWSRLLGEISTTMPRSVQLSVLESVDGSTILLDGKALSADAVDSFVDALGANTQIESAQLVKTGIGGAESEDMLTFSIDCRLASDTQDNSGFDRSRLFTPTEAEEFFGGMQPVLEDPGCAVKSLLISPKDAVFKDEKANGLITKKHAALTLQGGYQDILKSVEKLQDRSPGVWLDSVSITQDSETGQLECSMGISIYVAGDAG